MRSKLELTWIGKERRPRLEPRILLEEPTRSYHAAHRVTDHDLFENRLIFGDNLLALKALEQEFAGKIKCIYIDPPYNTGAAFSHYDDGVEHSLWLSLMRDRLEIFHRLLRRDGSIWVSIDDSEMPYLRVLMDEIFGRQHFVASKLTCGKNAILAKTEKLSVTYTSTSWHMRPTQNSSRMCGIASASTRRAARFTRTPTTIRRARGGRCL